MQVVNLTEHDIPEINKSVFEVLKYYFLNYFAKALFSYVQLQLFHQRV